MEMPEGWEQFRRDIGYLIRPEKTYRTMVSRENALIALDLMKEMAEVLEKLHEQLLDEYDGVDHWIEEMQVMKKFREWK